MRVLATVCYIQMPYLARLVARYREDLSEVLLTCAMRLSKAVCVDLCSELNKPRNVTE